jgi:hypothetical protein
MDYTDQDNQLFYDELTLLTGLVVLGNYHYALLDCEPGCEFIGPSSPTNQS